MSTLQFQFRDVLIELNDQLRLGTCTKRGQDLFAAIIQAIQTLQTQQLNQPPGGVNAMLSPSAPISTTQTQVLGATIAANDLQAGAVLRITAFGFVTSSANNNITFNLRVGPVTLAGTLPATLTCKPGNGGTVTGAGVFIELLLTIRSSGASGVSFGCGKAISLSSGAATTQALALANELFTSAAVAIDTTVQNIVELTCETAAATTEVTFASALIEVVRL